MQGITFKQFVLVKQSPYRDRTDIIKLFVDRLNVDRVGTKYRPLSFVAVQRLLEGIQEIHHLYSYFEDCQKAKHFSKYFYYKLNPEKYASNTRIRR